MNRSAPLRRFRPEAWQVLVLIGFVLGVARLFMPVEKSWQPMDVGMASAATAATVVGVRRIARERRLPWVIFGLAQAGTALYAAASVAGLIPETPGSLGIGFVALYLVALAGFVLLWRSLGPADLDAWLDACIVAVAVGILAWTFLIDTPRANTVDPLAIAAGVADLVLLLVIVRLFIRPVGPPSYLGLISAVAVMVGLYVTAYLNPIVPTWLPRLISGTWVLAFAAWGALAIHPAVHLIGARWTAMARPGPRRSIPFLFVLAVVLATPTIAFIRVVEGDGHSAAAVLAGTAVLALLMFARAGRVVRNLERDVEQRRAAEAAAVRSREQQVIARLAAEEREAIVQALVDQSPIGIGVFAPDGTALGFNAAAAARLSPAAVATTTGTRAILAPDGPWAETGLRGHEAAFSGTAVEVGPIPLTVERPAPEPASHLRATFYPVKGPSGEVVRVIGFFLDVSSEIDAADAQRRMEEELRETQKLEALGVLAGGIAHDFNNLLVPILGSIGVVRAELGAASPLSADLAQAEAAAERAADLARQMLAYSGRAAFVSSTVRLGGIVREMGDLVEWSVRKGVAVEFALDAAAWVVVDPTHLRQVILNLVVNASDAILGEGRIRIETGIRDANPADPHFVTGSTPPAGPSAWLSVADTGAGMDPATLARAFEPFYSTKGVGRGLGLATTLGIIRSMHGGLRVRTEPGAGTVFEVFLPLAAASEPVAAPAAAPAATAASATTARRSCVLLVDDEAAVRRLARRVLERAGWEVVEAADGLAGVERFMAEPGRFDVVLLDITLPRLDGLAVLARIREVRPRLPIVLNSGWTHDEVPLAILNQPATWFIQKPYRPQDLVDLVEGAVAAARALVD